MQTQRGGESRCVSRRQGPERKALVKRAPVTEEKDDSHSFMSPGKDRDQIQERVQFLKQFIL